MNTQSLISFLRFLERKQLWLFTLQNAAAWFQEERNTLKIALHRHVRTGGIIRLCRNLYANASLPAQPPYACESMVSYLRPACLTYVSLESRLSELGIISQLPNRLTCMTSGRGGEYRTSRGTVEFTHFARRTNTFREHLVWDSERKIYVASPKLAYSDLKRVGRNVNLIDFEELQECINEYSHARS